MYNLWIKINVTCDWFCDPESHVALLNAQQPPILIFFNYWVFTL